MLDKIYRILIGLVILGSPWIFYFLAESILPSNTYAAGYLFLFTLVPINVFGASAVFLTLTKFSKIRIIIIAAIIFSAYTIFIYVLISTSNAYF